MTMPFPAVQPPVAPPDRRGPEHYSPPAMRPPPGIVPLPVPSGAAPVTHGAGYEIGGTGTKSKHKTVFRVGTSQPGSPPVELPTAAAALAHLQQILQQAEAAGGNASDVPPPPLTASVIVTHVPRAVE